MGFSPSFPTTGLDSHDGVQLDRGGEFPHGEKPHTYAPKVHGEKPHRYGEKPHKIGSLYPGIGAQKAAEINP